jgi:hypothetical protein
VQQTAKERAGRNAEEDDRQEQRKDRAEAAEQDRKVAESQDLHPHGGEA